MGSSFGKCDFKGLEKLRKQIEQLYDKRNEFIESCAKELAARLLREVIYRTPVGEYTGEEYTCKVRKGDIQRQHYSNKVKGKNGGTLRRGWTGGEKQNAKDYANSLKIEHIGDVYKIEITNPVEYTSYVEHGHRTRDGEGWVEGHFMLTISEQEIQTIAPRILEDKLRRLLEEHFK